MKHGEEHSASRWRACAASIAICCVALLALLFGPSSQPAQGLPSFARQTGQPCGTCHTDYPALTPYGRRFKLLGYTVGGGAVKTTPFPDASPRFRPAEDRPAQA